MWILLSSVVVMMLVLKLYFLIGVGTICFSGVTLNTARPIVISWGSGETDVLDITEVLTVIVEIGDIDLPEQVEEVDEVEAFLLSGDLALEIVVMVTGDLALSGHLEPAVVLPFGLLVVWVGMMVMRDLGWPRVVGLSLEPE